MMSSSQGSVSAEDAAQGGPIADKVKNEVDKALGK